MRTLFFICLLFKTGISLGQNVNLEIADYSRSIDGKKYSTFQYVNSSYSFSRPTLVILTEKDFLAELSSKISSLFKFKQEYTDVWILGIDSFDRKNISEVDKKIIDVFFKQIIKYRADNSLPEYSLERLEANKVFVGKREEICRFLSCKKI